MKKTFAAILALVMILGVFAVGASAATKSDILELAATSPVYHYVKVSLENAARTVSITDAQADAVLPYVQDIVNALPEDLGPSAHDYTVAQQQRVMDDVNSICDVLEYELVTVEKTASSTPSSKHVVDYIFQFYDKAGTLVYEFDGDEIKKTDSVGSDYAWVYILGASVLVIAAGAIIILNKKRGLTK